MNPFHQYVLKPKGNSVCKCKNAYECCDDQTSEGKEFQLTQPRKIGEARLEQGSVS